MQALLGLLPERSVPSVHQRVGSKDLPALGSPHHHHYLPVMRRVTNPRMVQTLRHRHRLLSLLPLLSTQHAAHASAAARSVRVGCCGTMARSRFGARILGMESLVKQRRSHGSLVCGRFLRPCFLHR